MAKSRRTTAALRPVEEIVDELGAVRGSLAELDAAEKRLRAELSSRGITEAEGRVFRLTTTSAMRWSLDVARVKSEMGPAWVDARSRATVVTRVIVTPQLDAITKAAAAEQMAEAA